MFNRIRKAFATDLKYKATQFNMSPKQLRAWYKSQGLNDKDIDDAFSLASLNKIYSPHIGKLLPRAAAMVGRDPLELKENIKIEIVNSIDVECLAKPGSWFSKKHKLRIYSGLSFFINKLNRAFVSEILKKEGEPELPNAIKEASQLLDAYHGKFDKQIAWSISSLAMTMRQKLLSAILLGTLHEAAIAHEFGHIILFLVKGNILEHKMITNAFGQVDNWDSRWTTELTADVLGAQLLDRPTSSGEYTAMHALLIYILAIDMIEQKGAVQSTHPPAKTRREVLKTVFPQIEGNSMITQCEEVCRSILGPP